MALFALLCVATEGARFSVPLSARQGFVKKLNPGLTSSAGGVGTRVMPYIDYFDISYYANISLGTPREFPTVFPFFGNCFPWLTVLPQQPSVCFLGLQSVVCQKW